MKVLVDVNVFLDVLKRRSGWMESAIIITTLQSKEHQGVVSALTIPILQFLRVHTIGERESRKEIQEITRGYKIVSLTPQIIIDSFNSNLPEFEDNIQFFSAKKAGVDYIVTRNVKHYQQDEIPALTPDELLEKM